MNMTETPRRWIFESTFENTYRYCKSSEFVELLQYIPSRYIFVSNLCWNNVAHFFVRKLFKMHPAKVLQVYTAKTVVFFVN